MLHTIPLISDFFLRLGEAKACVPRPNIKVGETIRKHFLVFKFQYRSIGELRRIVPFTTGLILACV